MKHNRVILFLVFLVVASLACSLLGSGRGGSDDVLPGGDSIPNGVSPSSGVEEETENLDTDFPLPPNVENYLELGPGAINYQTTMALNDVVDFYRDAFESSGYTERDMTTVINATTFSIVWDGHPSGQAIVVQGVDLGDGSINVNVRLEDV